MSKFIDKLKRISEGEAQPLGFGARAATRIPQMVLGAIVAKDDIGIIAGAVEKGADVLLISMPSLTEGLGGLSRVSQLAADVPWGVWLESMTPEEVKQVREMGCDFILFGGASTPSTLLREEGLGRIMKIDTSLSDSLLRAIDRLPVDALLIGNGIEEPSLNVYQLMNYYRFVLLTRKPLLILVPASMSGLEVEMVWEAGLAGIFVKAKPGLLEDRLSALREAIDKLPLSRKKPRTPADVSLPYLGEQPARPERQR